MSQKNIIAYFRSEQRAKEAVQQLKRGGFESVDLSRFSLTPGEDVSDLDNPIAEPISSLATITGAHVSSRDAGILVSADVHSSGMADGSEEWGAEDLSVTVITDEERWEEAESILKQAGGRL
ncbi:hypothetical protein [Paludifilum halophilum]|uniref:General stress protein 17M-like domain-containing protein n=1 Tax=Paludifilum halophilum TaxID=1642702 RepID=A0A235B8J5_9BACL|nr:hypothetical protein [Paludifilum halophilum]OYD08309.1 hypothetical protein CHM34_05530 [Paludifilum halophilum]